MKRFMRAFDDFRGAIVTADASHQIEVGLAGVLCNKDVAGAVKIARRFAQRAPREQEFVSERSLTIYEHHVQPVFEMDIRKSIIEQESVDPPIVDGESAGVDSEFVHQDDYVLQVTC